MTTTTEQVNDSSGNVKIVASAESQPFTFNDEISEIKNSSK